MQARRGEIPLLIELISCSFRSLWRDQRGNVTLETILVLPIFAALALFTLSIGKIMINSIHSVSDARTATWMRARLDIEIEKSGFRAGSATLGLANKAAGMDLAPPFCQDGESSGEDEHKDRIIRPDNVVTGIRDSLRVGEGALVDDVFGGSRTEFFRSHCNVIAFPISRYGTRLSVQPVDEEAIVPNRFAWRFDEGSEYDLQCGFDKRSHRNLSRSFGRFDELFPDMFPREQGRSTC